MPPKQSSDTTAGGAGKNAKKKKIQKTIFDKGSKAKEIVSLNQLHREKRVLLHVRDLYNNVIPSARRDTCFNTQ